jgi:hypothetical protein
MSLADLVPLVLACDFQIVRYTSKTERATAKSMRWRRKNLEYWNAYRRAWRAKKRAELTIERLSR